MQITSAEIESIVRVVLQRLRSMTAPIPGSTSQPAAALASIPATDAEVLPGVVKLQSKLVTLEHITGRLAGTNVLEIPAKAIVTPAVLDELRAHRVQLVRVAPSVPPIDSAHTAASSIAVIAGNHFDAELQQLTEHFARSGQAAIWVCVTPFKALSAAWRVGQTALQLERLDDLPSAVQEAQPSVLVLDSRRWSATSVQQLVQAWNRSRA